MNENHGEIALALALLVFSGAFFLPLAVQLEHAGEHSQSLVRTVGHRSAGSTDSGIVTMSNLSESLSPFTPTVASTPGTSRATSTSTPESGTVVRTIGTGLWPYACLVDPRNGYTYIPDSGSGSVTVVNGSLVVANVSVGSQPFQCGLDPRTGWVYVLDLGSMSVSVLNGADLQANITVGSQPDGIAYDSANGWIYVSNLKSNSVSIISGTTLIATVSVGLYPRGVTFDASNGFVYVANIGTQSLTVLNGTTVSYNVTGLGGQPFFLSYNPASRLVYAAIENTNPGLIDVIDGSMVVANISVGVGPWMPIFDPTDGWAYVSCEYGNNVSVLNGTTLIASIDVGVSPYTPVYDSENGYVYVPNYGPSPWTAPSTVSVISKARVIATIAVGAAPNSAVYDPADGWVYVANGGNGAGTTVMAISTVLGEGPIQPRPPGPIEVGVHIVMNSTLWGIGAGGDTASAILTPSTGLSCEIPIGLTQEDRFAELSLACTPASAGNYTVDFKVTDSTLNSVDAVLNISVEIGPTAILSLPRESYDVGQEMNASVSGSRGSGGYVFSWSGLPPECSNESSRVTCILRTAGTFSITVGVTDSVGGTGSSAPVVISVFQTLVLAPISVGGQARVGDILSFTTSATGGAPPLEFTWSFGDGNSSSAVYATHAFEKGGNYTVTTEVNDSANASVEVSIDLEVAAAPNPAEPWFQGALEEIAITVVAGVLLLVVAVVWVRRKRT